MIGTYDDPRPKARTKSRSHRREPDATRHRAAAPRLTLRGDSEPPQMLGYQLVASGKSFAYYRPETSDRHASRLAHHQLLIEAWTGKTDASLPGTDIIDISPVTEKIDKL